MFGWDEEYFVENCLHVPCLNTSRNYTSEKICKFCIGNAKLRCCFGALIQVHHKIRNYLWGGAINIIAKSEEVIGRKKYSPVVLRYTKLLSRCFLTVWNNSVPYGEAQYSYKIDSSCCLSSTDKYDLRCHYSL